MEMKNDAYYDDFGLTKLLSSPLPIEPVQTREDGAGARDPAEDLDMAESQPATPRMKILNLDMKADCSPPRIQGAHFI